MSEATPEAPAQEPTNGTQQPAETPTPSWDEVFKGEDPVKVKEALEQSRKWEARAKENLKAKTELEKQQQASMTEAERAVAEAETRGRTAATTEFGKELAQTQFDALAGRRNPDFDTAKALEFVDLTKFLGEDGKPDGAAITAAVERLVPAPAPGTPSFDGGTRTTAPAPQGMSQMIRQAAGRA